ncbi:MAG: type II secretion system protein [Myxococcales bacterium]|nr:type II secretion system protein [Myxococcales bacterium]
MAKRWLAQITLGELMVAVAIIGLLAATVLPTFLRAGQGQPAGEAALSLRHLFEQVAPPAP